MTIESEHEGFAHEQVPEAAQGSGWRIFFIVAGSLCGLPVFILSAQIFGGLGFERGLKAVLIGAAIAAALGACTAYAGSRSRMGLAMLTSQTFGPLGAHLVKLVIAVSLIGWFGVNIGVLGATAASAITQMTGYEIPPMAIGLPICVAIAAMTLAGATGLERLGSILVPVTLLVLLTSVAFVSSRLTSISELPGSGSIEFGQAVSAVVGSYIVGIVIQPDYGRFVRRPRYAALGALAALGIAFPLVLTLSSLASMALGAPQLISAMILLGFGLPALIVLLLGAWIDTSACLYSASLSLVNQFPRFRFLPVVVCVTLVGIVLVAVGADKVFIPFLVALGLCLPPLASILVLSTIIPPASFPNTEGQTDRAGWVPMVSWAGGIATAVCASRDIVTLTTLPALDSILAAAALFVLAKTVFEFRSRNQTTMLANSEKPAAS